MDRYEQVTQANLTLGGLSMSHELDIGVSISLSITQFLGDRVSLFHPSIMITIRITRKTCLKILGH